MAWTIDTAHTTVGFMARHMGLSKVRGQFTSFRGCVENHPTMVFESRSVIRDGDDYKLVGDLTIKGITREVELKYEHGGEATDPYGNWKVGGTLTGTIKRSDWDLTWNALLDTGGVLVRDRIQVEFDVSAIKES